METQITSIADAVTKVGYPVVSAIALAIWSVLQDRQFRAERKEERKAYLAQLTTLTDAVRANTAATVRAVSALDRPRAA